MPSSKKERGDAILEADDDEQYAVVELLTRSYVSDFPKDPLFWITRGRALSYFHRWGEADGAFDQALSVAIKPEQEPFIWREKGESYKSRGMVLEAEKCYERLVELEPDDGFSRVLLANATWRRGDLKLAETRYRDALAIEGKEECRDLAFLFFGGLLVALGRLEEAATCYREVLQILPDNEPAQMRLADVERALELQREMDDASEKKKG